MNRVAALALIGGFLASSAAASGALANQVTREESTHRTPAVVEQPLASVAQPLTAPAATLAPANASQRVIHASQASTRAALPPAAAELLPASQGSGSSCPPIRTDVACRKP